MNAKEEILQILRKELMKFDGVENCGGKIIKLVTLITAVESAIFDVPSEDDIWKEANKITLAFSRERFLTGCNFILNYKKPESDEK